MILHQPDFAASTACCTLRRMRWCPGVRASLMVLILLWGTTAPWHQYDLSLHRGDHVCGTCIVAHALDSMAVAAAPPIICMPLFAAQLIPFAGIHVTPVPQSYCARTPPRSTPH